METETDTEKPQNKPKNQPTVAAAEVVSLKPETTSALQPTVVDLLPAERQDTLNSCVIISKNTKENSINNFCSGETKHCCCLVDLMKFPILNGELDEDEDPEEELPYAIYRLKGFLL